MRCVVLGFIGAFGLAAVASGAAVTYTNEADFLNQLAPGYYLENFDAFTFGSYTDATLDLAQGPWAYTIGAAGDGTNTLYSGDSNMSTNSAGDALTVNFTGQDVYAVGGFFFPGDIGGFFLAGPMEITLSDGTFYTFDAVSDTDFVGFISDTPILSMTIEAPDVNDIFAWPTMDHFYVGEQIPAPGVLALLGVAGLVGGRRRR